MANYLGKNESFCLISTFICLHLAFTIGCFITDKKVD